MHAGHPGRRKAAAVLMRLLLCLELDWETRGTVDVQCFAGLPGLIARQPKAFHPPQQFRQGYTRLQPGQGGPEAEVKSMTKGDVRVGFTGNVEPIGLLELLRVTVSRSHH